MIGLDELWFGFKHQWARLICNLIGCIVRHYSSAYMPDDYHSPDYCERCDACHDIYNVETTPWPLIYPQESMIGKLKSKLGGTR